MAHRYAGGNSKKPVAIIVAVAVAVLAAAVVAILFVLNSGKSDNKGETTRAATSVAQTIAETTVAGTQSNSDDSAKPDQSVIETEQPQSLPEAQSTQSGYDESSAAQSIVVPTKGTGEIGYFNATYIPYKAVDKDTNSEVSLREVFGTSYSQGVLTFNSDGSFTDSMYASEAESGAYVVEGEDISATYSNDKNMQITVNEWENGSPKDFVVNYGGYDVYFAA